MPRELPAYVLKARPAPSPHWEGNYVQNKFADSKATIDGSNVDCLALTYMNDIALLYWLPRFLAFLKATPNRSSNLFDDVLTRLSDEGFVKRLKPVADSAELDAILSYLNWLKSASGIIVSGSLANTECEMALALWL